MARQLPPLNAIRAFEAAARNTNFTSAAKELRVSQGAVSRHIVCLEQWLGLKLFVRVHRGVELTPQGSTYFRLVKSALDQIDSGSRQLKRSSEDGPLRLKLPPTFALRWLVPRLARFHALHPKTDVQITTSHEPADFDRDDVDVSIYSWPEPPTGPGYRRLFGEVLLVVCAPGLIERRGPLRVPQDLASHVLLCSLHRPCDWPTWLAAAQVSHIDGNGGLKFENAALAYQAAVDELGVMVAQYAFVEEDLRTGRLIAPLPLRVRTGGAYSIGFHPRKPMPARVQAFEDWVAKEAAEIESRFPPAGVATRPASTSRTLLKAR